MSQTLGPPQDPSAMGSASPGGSGSPAPDGSATRFSSTLQAEAATLYGGAAASTAIAGAQGGSHVALPDAADTAITFTVEVPRDGFYTLEFRHALGGTSDATRNLLVDGVDIPGAITLPNLYSDEVWGTARERLELPAGTTELTLTGDRGDETIGIGTEGTPVAIDSLTVTEGTAPSSQTSARSLLMNNGADMLAIHESAFTSAKDFEGYGPYLAQLRHGSDWTVDHLEGSTAWFRDTSPGSDGRTLAPAFDSTLFLDETGLMRVEYGDYLPTGEALPISIARDYAMVPGQPLLVERWTLNNQTEVGDDLVTWDMMPTLDLSGALMQSAEWDERRETWIVEITPGEGHDPLWLAWGAFQEMDGQQGDDAGGNAGFRVPYGEDPATTQGDGPDVLGRFASGAGLAADDVSAAGEGVRLAMSREDIDLYPTRPVELYFYTTMAESREELEANIATALNPQGTNVAGSASFWVEQTQQIWEERLAEAKQLPETGERAITDPALQLAYERSLVSILQSQQPEYGSFVAATNPAYEFKVWPRDSAVTAISLDSAGLLDDAGRYWKWMASVEEDGEDPNPLFEDGTFYTNYSFFEANQGIDFVQPEWDAQGLFLIGAYRHGEALREAGREADAEAFFADPVMRDALVDSAEFIRDSIDETGFGAPEFSIWEEFLLYNVYTQVTYAQGLNAAALMAEDLGAPELEAGWREGAVTIRDAMLRPTTAETPGLWNEEEGWFAWGVTPDGEALVDRQENSANLAIVTGLLDADDPRALRQIESSIANTSHDTYGISRYDGDTFYSSSPYSPGGTYESRVDEAVWPQMTSYVGMAKEYQGDADWALGSLQWTAGMYGEEFMPPGEGVDWSTREPLPSTMVEPVTGGWYVLNLLNYAGLNDLRLPSDELPEATAPMMAATASQPDAMIA